MSPKTPVYEIIKNSEKVYQKRPFSRRLKTFLVKATKDKFGDSNNIKYEINNKYVYYRSRRLMDKLLLTILFLLILSPSILASYQTPEVLIYKGKIYDLQSNPLEAYYADKSPRFLIDPYYESSGNSRGYVATWEVIDEKLYLSKIDSWFCNKSIRTKSGCRRVTLKDLFGKKVVNGKVSASWFSGQLEVTDGETIPCASEPGLPIFEREIIFEVDAGKIGEPSIIDNLKRLDLYKRCSRQQRKPS